LRRRVQRAILTGQSIYRVMHMKIRPTLKVILFVALLLVIAFSGLALPRPARAQDSSGDVLLEALRIDIWPEYDKPSVLVIYHITLSDQTALPASMKIRIPAAVGEPFAVAIQEPNGLFNLSYETKTSGAWEEITFITTVADVRIEYYDPSLTKNSAARSFTYTWAGDYTVNNLSLQVQQPGGATNMQIKPDMGSGSQADDGLTYFSYLAGKVNAGTTFDVKIAYDKASDELTSAGAFQQVTPSQPIDDSTPGRVTMGQWRRPGPHPSPPRPQRARRNAHRRRRLLHPVRQKKQPWRCLLPLLRHQIKVKKMSGQAAHFFYLLTLFIFLALPP
jgi:hypothetical protein